MPISPHRLFQQRAQRLSATTFPDHQLPNLALSRSDSQSLANSSCESIAIDKKDPAGLCPPIERPQTTTKRVAFGSVQIRSYQVVIGDHPFCQAGCALSLGWDYDEDAPQPLDAFEASRQDHRRQVGDLKTTWDERHQRLLENGAWSRAEIRQANRSQQRRRNHRIQRSEQSLFFDGRI